VRGFLLVACSVLLAIGIGVAAIAAESHPSGETRAESFAQHVLAEAALPPHSHLTSKVTSGILDTAPVRPGVSDLIDLHRLYMVDSTPDLVQSDIEAKLPKGADVISHGYLGGPPGSASDFEVSVPTSGPNEYLAELAYEMAPVGTNDTELRVDAQTVWLPDRPAGELAPDGNVVDVTWFSRVGYDEGSSGPVTTRLSNGQATALRRVLNALPLGPSPTVCMEDALLYKIVFHPTRASASSFEADGWTCSGVLVTSHGRKLAPLSDAHCSLLRTVIDLIPARQVEGTKAFACSTSRNL